MTHGTVHFLIAFGSALTGWCLCWAWHAWRRNQNRDRLLEPDDCIYGRCHCETALQCRFPRCKNCDNVVDSSGKTLDDRWAEDWKRCPVCGGALPAS